MLEFEKYSPTIKELIDDKKPIFNFYYPFYIETEDEECDCESRLTRWKFEEDFKDYFMYSQIGFETYEEFRDRLKIKMRLIMPYWNKILESLELEQRILDNYDVTETYTIETSSTDLSSMSSEDSYSNQMSGSMSPNTTSKIMNSNTPKQKKDIDNIDYFSSIQKTVTTGCDSADQNGSGSSQSLTSGQKEGTGLTKYESHKTGNIGVQYDAQAIEAYWRTVRKVEQEIFDELSCLFMGVY